MTALSPGPWSYDLNGTLTPHVWDANEQRLAQVFTGETDGRAMASAHEALAVIRRYLASTEELVKLYTAETGKPGPGADGFVAPPWVAWLTDRALETNEMAKAVLEKAGVR